MNLSKSDIAAVVSQIQEVVPDVQAIYIFGSYASGLENESSDLDLAFLAKAELAGVALYDLRQNLAVAVNCDVDLVQLRRAAPVLRNEIIQGGQVIFLDSEFDLPSYELYVISSFLDFQEGTKSLREAIQKRGYVRG